MTQDRTNHLRTVSQLAKLLLGACLSAGWLPATAQAFVMPDPLTYEHSGTTSCPVRRMEPAAAAGPVDGAEATKSNAILGGQPSALDLIRQQQGQLSQVTPAVRLASVANVPVAYSSSCFTASSLDTTMPVAARTSAIAAQVSADDFLGSSRVGIRNTPFNGEWQRVSSANLASSNVETLLGGGGQADVETLSLVNRWANRSIEYTDDLANYGARDYWATANETLRSGRGDCEDFAILKYQMLAALGFDRRQMFLTLARDLVRNADHAVLIVRVGGRQFMLDNATDVLLPAGVSYDYRPTMSFNTESAWLHGFSTPAPAPNTRQPAQAQFSYLSDSALSNARVTGFNR
jgi:predicted transglutaminase-like cysteine proteinase